MTQTQRMAEAFHPGEYLREELEEREWSQLDLVDITGQTPKTINEIVKEKRSINASLAVALGNALGTSADYWLNLQSVFDLWKTRTSSRGESDEIARKAELYTFPVREMARRKWIADKATADELEAELCRFFETDSLKTLPIAAKKADHEQPLTKHQIAWMYRTKHLAQTMDHTPYSQTKLKASLKSLRELLQHPEDTASVASVLSEAGVRLLVVEGLPGLKLDGVCYWLDDTPVIAMTMRLDRIDNFWFVLRHEIEHVLRADAKGRDIKQVTPDSIDTTMKLETHTDSESIANEAASEFCVPKAALSGFIASKPRRFSGVKVATFASTIQVHPGMVVGQLHHRGQLPYENLRRHLVKVRDYVIETTMTDGWGSTPQLT